VTNLPWTAVKYELSRATTTKSERRASDNNANAKAREELATTTVCKSERRASDNYCM
jgi:hypothetical protein